MIYYHFAISNSILFPADNYKENVLTLTLIGKSRKQNPKIGKSPTVFHGNKIRKNF